MSRRVEQRPIRVTHVTTVPRSLRVPRLETVAIALPVIGTRNPGCGYAVSEGETGRLVSTRDAPPLGLAVEGCAKEPALRERHGQAGRRRVPPELAREHVWLAIADRYRAHAGAHSVPGFSQAVAHG